ncbi:hypothetical protein VNI00_015810 [Paramarasmius palmivorus]|uniref:DUF6699 domain-containing protein n=1 Tax=Paramarasmius palmivorus TaxID=297713 RepID=A0AAW0BJ01_9AGAR
MTGLARSAKHRGNLVSGLNLPERPSSLVMNYSYVQALASPYIGNHASPTPFSTYWTNLSQMPSPTPYILETPPMLAYLPSQWSVYLPPLTARSRWSYGYFYDEKLLGSPACLGAERLIIRMGNAHDTGDATAAWMNRWGDIQVHCPRVQITSDYNGAPCRQEITVLDVLQAIYVFLHVRLTPEEAEMLDMEGRNHVFAARSSRVFLEGSVRDGARSWMEWDEWNKPPMRVDVLTVGGATKFGNLSLWPDSNGGGDQGVFELLLRLE